VSRVSPTSSESERNASGQVAFVTKVPQTPVVESPTASAADVTSTTAGVETAAAPRADKVGISTPPATEGEGGDRDTFGPQEEPPSGGIFAKGMEVVNDEDRCVYAGTPWEAEVVTNCRDLEKFREAAHTISTMLLVRILSKFPCFLLWLPECHEVLMSSVARRKRGQSYYARRPTRT
jgi:hypothetical protein